jgi:hypothetical protein
MRAGLFTPLIRCMGARTFLAGLSRVGCGGSRARIRTGLLSFLLPRRNLSIYELLLPRTRTILCRLFSLFCICLKSLQAERSHLRSLLFFGLLRRQFLVISPLLFL